MSQCRTLQPVASISKTFAVLAGLFSHGKFLIYATSAEDFHDFEGVLYTNRVAKGCTCWGLRLDSCSCSPSIAVPRHQACHGTGHTQLTEVIKQLCSIPVEVVFGLKKSSSWEPAFLFEGRGAIILFFQIKIILCIYIYGFLMIMASCSPIGADTCLSSAPKSLHNESWPRVVYLTYNKGNGSHILHSYTRLSLYHDISCDITPHHIFVCLSYQMFMSDTQLIVLIHQRSFLPKMGIIQDSSRKSSGYIAERRQRGTWGPILQKGTAVRHLDLYCIHILVYMDFMWICCIRLGWWWFVRPQMSIVSLWKTQPFWPLLSIHGGIHCLLLR